MKKEYPYRKIGARLRFLRGDVTQREFASTIGVSERSYQRYELGESPPNYLTMNRISALCGVEIGWILKGGPEDKPLSIKEVSNIHRSFFKGRKRFADLSLEDLIEERKKFRIEREKLKSKLKKPPKQRPDPRLPLATDMLKEIFSMGAKDLINDVMEALDAASTLAAFGLSFNSLEKLTSKKGTGKAKKQAK